MIHGRLEDRQIGGDLDRGPPKAFFEIVVKGLGDQPTCLAQMRNFLGILVLS